MPFKRPSYGPQSRPSARFGRFATRRSLAALSAAALAITLLAGCSTDFKPDEARDIQTITIRPGANIVANTKPRDCFSPDPSTVNRQTEVRWVNGDTTAHQIASVGGFFGSPEPTPPGERFTFLFTEAGSYRYYCALPGHKEQGVINVLQ